MSYFVLKKSQGTGAPPTYGVCGMPNGTENQYSNLFNTTYTVGTVTQGSGQVWDLSRPSKITGAVPMTSGQWAFGFNMLPSDVYTPNNNWYYFGGVGDIADYANYEDTSYYDYTYGLHGDPGAFETIFLIDVDAKYGEVWRHIGSNWALYDTLTWTNTGPVHPMIGVRWGSGGMKFDLRVYQDDFPFCLPPEGEVFWNAALIKPYALAV